MFSVIALAIFTKCYGFMLDSAKSKTDVAAAATIGGFITFFLALAVYCLTELIKIILAI